MIKNPAHGWCDFKIGDFIGHPSYVTNVPVDLLEALRDYKCKGQGMAWFDEEGTEFTLVLTPYSLYVIEEKDEAILHDFSKLKVDSLIDETVMSIESDLQAWVEFSAFDEKKEIERNRETILELIDQIREVDN